MIPIMYNLKTTTGSIMVNLQKLIYIWKVPSEIKRYHIGFDFGGMDDTYYLVEESEAEKIEIEVDRLYKQSKEEK